MRHIAYQSCLEVVVTPLIEHDTTRTSITTVRNLVAAAECVAFRITAIYGWPVDDSNTDSMSPRQNINVTIMSLERKFIWLTDS